MLIVPICQTGVGIEVKMISGINSTLGTALSLWQSTPAADATQTAPTLAAAAMTGIDPRSSVQTSMDSIFAILKAANKQSNDPAGARTPSDPATGNGSSSASSDSLFGNLSVGQASEFTGQMGTTAKAAYAAAQEAMENAQGANGGASAIAYVMKAENGTVSAAVAETYGAASVRTSTIDQIDKTVQAFVSNNSLSAQEITKTLYAGGGLTWSPGYGTDTFASQLASIKSTAESYTKSAAEMASWVTSGKPYDGNYSRGYDDKSADFIANTASQWAKRGMEGSIQASQLATAFANHAITFQKAIDVKGLDFSRTMFGSATVSGGSASAAGSVNRDFFSNNADGKQHAEMDFGGVAMFLTY